MRRLSIAALLGAALLLACLAGCLGEDPTAAAPAAPTTRAETGLPLSSLDPAAAAPVATFGAGLELEVVYSGMWSGAWGSPEAKHSDERFGNATLPLPQNVHRIEAEFQKQEQTDEPLTLRLVQNGVVLKESSGSGPGAVVTLAATPAP